jgi:threonine synthase
MHALSTRSVAEVKLGEAIARGLAPDGGLYVPKTIPHVGAIGARDLSGVAEALLAPYFVGEVLEHQLGAICRATYTFDAPVTPLGGDDHLLELFHGPTAAFKDFGARFLAECMARDRDGERMVLVATSGDTGAAVAAAFHRRPGFRAVILYPDGRVSARQAHQLGAFRDNVRAFRVAGSFDDCQRMAKEAFADGELTRRFGLTSANSINLGRLLPQIAYYARAALTLNDRDGAPPSFVIPSGNLGNALACLIGRKMGLPIAEIVLATNANRVLVELVNDERWEPRPSIATLANAMDVGAPSNVERLRWLFPDGLTALSADAVTDDEIRPSITRLYKESGRVVCPHTACGVEVLRRKRAAGARGTYIVAATAHPAKFADIVEPLIGASVPAPPALAEILARPAHAAPIAATLEALVSHL